VLLQFPTPISTIHCRILHGAPALMSNHTKFKASYLSCQAKYNITKKQNSIMSSTKMYLHISVYFYYLRQTKKDEVV